MTIRIAGIGTHLPPKVVTNADLAKQMDTSDDWIRERAGIGERHVGGTTSEMAVAAGIEALSDASLTPDQIDLLVLATTSPDQRFPATSAVVQSGIGLGCGAFDVNAVCAGFLYGYMTAYGLMSVPGGPDRVLLCGADAMASLTDWTDRSTAILFGDGAGAVVLERHDQGAMLGFDLGADGNLNSILYCDHGDFIKMEGREVFKKAVRAVVKSVDNALANAGLEASDIDVFLPHQANIRIIEAVANRVGISMEKTHNVIDHTGNTSSASIPLAMAKAKADGVLRPGAKVCMTGFGGGMTWGTAIIEW